MGNAEAKNELHAKIYDAVSLGDPVKYHQNLSAIRSAIVNRTP